MRHYITALGNRRRHTVWATKGCFISHFSFLILHFTFSSIRRAFTFLEMATVITILGVLLILTIPSMRGLHNLNKLETASHDLAALLRYARSQSVFQERTVEVRIDFRAGRYRLDLMSTPDDSLERHHSDKPVAADEERIRKLPDGVVFADMFVWEEQINDQGNVVIEFYPNGAATPVVAVVKDKEGRTMTVEVSRCTGQTRLTQGRPQEVALPGQTEVLRKKVVVQE